MKDERVEEIRAIINIHDEGIYVEDANDALDSLVQDLERAKRELDADREVAVGCANEEWWREAKLEDIDEMIQEELNIRSSAEQ